MGVTLQQLVRCCLLFSVFNTFSYQIRSSHVLKYSSKTMLENLSVTSNLAVTTCIMVDYSKEYFFFKGIFESKQVTKSASGSKNNI